MNAAAAVVKSMLEDDYDAHVKAHKRVQSWDGAHASFKTLYGLRKQSLGLYKEMGRSIAYERALAHVGLTPADVQMHITGAQIGSTHNFKGGRTVRRCKNVFCKDRRPQPEEQAECPTCGEKLKTEQVPWSRSDLQGKLARYIFGVETKDHRYVWFNEPVPPEPEAELQPEIASPTAPMSAKEFGEGGRFSKIIDKL